MSDLIVDAQLLACPSIGSYSADSFQTVFTAYLSRLCDLTALRSCCKSFRFWRDEELASVLHDQECYPFRHSLKQAFQQLFDPAEFQLEDINILATALLEKSMRLEVEGEVLDIVVSQCSLDGDPVGNRSEIFLKHLCRVIALALPVLGDGVVFNPNTYLASIGSETSPKKLVASYKVDLAEFANGEYSEDFPPISVPINNYRGTVQLFNSVDLSAWWRAATDQAVLEVLAVSAGISQPIPLEKIESILASLSIGAKFIASAEPFGFMHEPAKITRLMRVCGDLIKGNNLANSHWLRIGRGPNDAQTTRGGWKAWRHDIDDEFHLHYWRSGLKIEIANVVTHNDFDITH